MTDEFKGKIGIKVAVKVNLIILIVMIAGTFVLTKQQSTSLEADLLSRGKIQSIIGAKMIGRVLEEAIDNGVFPVADAFDTEYEQIGNFEPPKFHTRYDFYLDKAILDIQDEFLGDASIIYAVASDKNGYIPTHNTRYQKPITGDKEKDKVGNRTKRVFNDPVGLAASQNKTKGYQQVYYRDTGETMWDISSPITLKGKHWGGFRVGYSLVAVKQAKKKLIKSLIAIMGAILLSSILLSFLVVNSSLNPIRKLAVLAEGIANGKYLEDEIAVTSKDEVGALQTALDRLRLSIIIALKRRRS